MQKHRKHYIKSVLVSFYLADTIILNIMFHWEIYNLLLLLICISWTGVIILKTTSRNKIYSAAGCYPCLLLATIIQNNNHLFTVSQISMASRPEREDKDRLKAVLQLCHPTSKATHSHRALGMGDCEVGCTKRISKIHYEKKDAKYLLIIFTFTARWNGSILDILLCFMY